MKSSSYFTAILIFFSLVIVSYTFHWIETTWAEKPYLNMENNKKNTIFDPEGQQDNKFQIKTNLKEVKIVSNIMISNSSLNSQIIHALEDNYSNYLKTTTDNSVNLTKAYQDKIALWNGHLYSNTNMAKITETFLTEFINQLNQ